MGLFSSWFRRQPKALSLEALFTEREFEFNRERLDRAIVKQSEALYEYRNDESHKVFADYVRHILNREMLLLADAKQTTPEAYAYHRGRIDALRTVLNTRETYIQNKENLRKSPTKGPGEQEAKRSYVRAPSTQAGLSI